MSMLRSAPRRMLTRAVVVVLFWYVYIIAKSSLTVDVLAQARRQSKPRRWPWQPKTARDYIDAYRADLAAIVSQQGSELLAAVQRQSGRRRWPWQPKTIRDLLEERSAELVALAAEWSAELAEAAAKRATALRATAERQIRPRRWPWQPKTFRDRVSERNVELATRAAERSAELAALARQRRDALLKVVRRQSQPRRWPWQHKTIRDQIRERGKQVISATDRLTRIANSSAQTASQTASAVAQTASQTAGAVGERMQQLRAVAPSVIDSATSTAASTLEETAQNVSTTLNETAETAAAAVQRPVKAVIDNVQAGRRRARRSVRLVRTALWAVLIGIVVGLLFARTSGAELRRQIGAILERKRS